MYSDNRDIVKWATLTHIAKAYNLRTILQVPYLRPEALHPHFSFVGKRLPISEKVWQFFRNVHDVTRHGDQVGISINVVAHQFEPARRDAYMSHVETEIAQAKHPFLLFLDPDTGLQPVHCKPEHTVR